MKIRNEENLKGNQQSTSSSDKELKELKQKYEKLVEDAKITILEAHLVENQLKNELNEMLEKNTQLDLENEDFFNQINQLNKYADEDQEKISQLEREILSLRGENPGVIDEQLVEEHEEIDDIPQQNEETPLKQSDALDIDLDFGDLDDF